MQRRDVMSTEIHRYRMAVAIDDSEYAEIVLEHALDVAVRHDAVDIHFVTVVADDEDVDAAGRRLAKQLLEAFEPVREAPGDRRVRLHVRVGKTVEEIVRFAADIDADLLVIGRFGAHSRHRSVASAIVDSSPCPALVVGLTEHEIDASPRCEDCAAIRAVTDAEVLFCEAHRGDPRLHSSSLMPWTSGLSHGRLW